MNIRKILAVAVIVFSAGIVQAQVFSELYCFGDSLTDTGNTNTDAANAEYWNGRYTNGPVWVEYMAEHLGLTAPAASNLGGTNYAVGGAKTADVISQVNSYLAGHTVDTNALYILDGGGNDAVDYSTVTFRVDDAEATGQNMVNAVNTLVSANAKNIMVMSVPELGLTPAAAFGVAVDILDSTDVATQWAADANAVLLAGLDTIAANNPDVTIYYLDAFSFMQQVAADPSAYGITNMTEPAFSGIPFMTPGTVVENPSEYFFYDLIHPTTAVHGMVGDYAYEMVVPEPLSISFLLFGGAAVLLKRKKIA